MTVINRGEIVQVDSVRRLVYVQVAPARMLAIPAYRDGLRELKPGQRVRIVAADEPTAEVTPQ